MVGEIIFAKSPQMPDRPGNSISDSTFRGEYSKSLNRAIQRPDIPGTVSYDNHGSEPR